MKPKQRPASAKKRSTRPAETVEAKRSRTRAIIARLIAEYPTARCSLDHLNPLELLVATVLSAQCTRQAKTINFGIIYGMGPFGLARELRISNASARAAIERYFDHYAGVKQFITCVIHETRERGYSQRLLGRRRPIPELRSRNRTVRQQGERLAVNTTIQGTAADLIKKAMIEIDHTLTVDSLRTGMILQVHDELIFEVPFEELEQVKILVREKMENAYSLSVPLRVDLGWGTDWAAAHG